MNDPLTESSRAAQALWDIQAGFLRKAAYLQFSLATLGFESGVRQWHLLNTLAQRHELFAGQKEIAESFQPRFAAIAREGADNLRTAGAALAGWFFGKRGVQPAVIRASAPRAKSRPVPRRTPRRKSG
jgi:hypothetical protein